jgi:hypothetical protein
MARIKRSVDSGSPWLRGLPCFMGSPAMPFKSTFEDKEVRIAEIQSRYLLRKPK